MTSRILKNPVGALTHRSVGRGTEILGKSVLFKYI